MNHSAKEIAVAAQAVAASLMELQRFEETVIRDAAHFLTAAMAEESVENTVALLDSARECAGRAPHAAEAVKNGIEAVRLFVFLAECAR